MATAKRKRRPVVSVPYPDEVELAETLRQRIGTGDSGPYDAFTARVAEWERATGRDWPADG